MNPSAWVFAIVLPLFFLGVLLSLSLTVPDLAGATFFGIPTNAPCPNCGGTPYPNAGVRANTLSNFERQPWVRAGQRTPYSGPQSDSMYDRPSPPRQ